MVSEYGLYPAAQIDSPLCISPQLRNQVSSAGGRTQVFSTGSRDPEVASGGDVESERNKSAERVVIESESIEADEEGRHPRRPLSISRPTKKEIEEHCVTHWPFRSWCRHCVCGRAQVSPHFARSDLDRQLGRNGPPTISMDHCFLGSTDEESTAHSSPFLSNC